MPSIDEIYVEIKLLRDQVKSDLAKFQSEVEGKARGIQDKLKFQARFDSSLAKLDMKELVKYREKLQKVFDRKLKFNDYSGSLQRTRAQIQAVDNQMQGLTKTSTSMGTKIVQGLLALGAIRGLFTTLKNSINLSIEQAKAEAGVEEAIKRTGQAAGFTATQLKAVASELQGITGVGDEEILKGVTKQLLTFTKITGDSFLRAQKAVLDLNSVIAGGEISGLTSQSIQLGKALENPLQGITALTRAGITFTAEQKKQIAVLVQSGDMLSAQSIILSEIENKYGGQAEAMAKADKGLRKMHSAWGDMLESLGNYITQSSLGSFVIENFTGGLKTITKWLQGASYETAQLNKRLDDLKSNSAKITLEQLKNSTQNFRDELRKYNTDQLTLNKTQVVILKQQIQQEALSVRFNDDKLNSLNQQLKTMQNMIAIQEGEISALDTYEEKINRAKKGWDKTGKTVDQINERIDDLTALIGGLEPGDLLSKNAIKEIRELQKLLPNISGEASNVKSVFDEISSSIGDPKKKLEEIKKLLAGLKDTKQNIELKATLIFEKEKIEQEIAKRQIEIGIKPVLIGDYEKQLQELQVKLNSLDPLDIPAKIITEEGIKDLQEKISKLKIEAGIEVDFDAGNIDTTELEKAKDEITKQSEEISRVGSEENMKRQEAIDDFYKSTQRKDEDYYAWKLLKIAEETKAIQEATDDKILAEKYRIEQQQELEQEYFDWKVEQFEKDNKVAALGLRTMTDGFTDAFNLIRIRTKDTASELEKIFVNMANSFIMQVQRMAAEWLAFQLLKGVVGLIFAPLTGGASAIATVPGLKQGGEFFRGKVTPYNQIPKFATGTEFNVPSKFTNDSFLMRVSGDERVKVTPANKVGDSEKFLASMADKLDVLNANLVEKSFAPVINNSLELDGRRVTKAVYKTMSKMQKEGRTL